MSEITRTNGLKQRPICTAVMGAVMGLAVAGSPALAADVSSQPIMIAASCSACNPCNPCEPSESEGTCNPCNPCEPSETEASCNPCNPCNPCAAD